MDRRVLTSPEVETSHTLLCAFGAQLGEKMLNHTVNIGVPGVQGPSAKGTKDEVKKALEPAL